MGILWNIWLLGDRWLVKNARIALRAWRACVQSGPMFRRLFHVVLGWFAIWFVVGLFALAIPYESPVGHFEDFLFMALAAAVIFLDAARRVGWALTGAMFLWVATISGAVELLGAKTGFPFGAYAYTDRFGPVVGVLPWAIPLAWWVVLYPLLLLTMTLAREKLLTRWLIAPAAALGAVAVDVTLEPVATLVRGYWVWEGPGAYYGVPTQNFVAWFVTSLIILGPIQYFVGRTVIDSYRNPGAIFLPLATLGAVLFSFLVAGLVHGLWLASGWTLFLTLMLTMLIIRFAWPRRDVFMLERHGRYCGSDTRPYL